MHLLGNWSFIYKKETHIDTVERDEKKVKHREILYSGFTAARTFMACITGIATYPFSKQYSIKLQMQIYI
jgi:hypothetical protein